MTRTAVAVLALALTAVAPAGRAEAPRRDHDITVHDYFTQADLFDLAVSPDGKRVAYTEGRWQESTNDRKTDMWVVESGLLAGDKVVVDGLQRVKSGMTVAPTPFKDTQANATPGGV